MQQTRLLPAGYQSGGKYLVMYEEMSPRGRVEACRVREMEQPDRREVP